METFENINFNESKIHKNMKKNRINMYPVSLINKIDSKNEMDFYWGEWDLQGNMEGFGRKIFSNGGFYFGTFKKNKMDGIGIYLFSDQGNEISHIKLLGKKDKFKFLLSRSLNYMFYKTFSSKNEFIKFIMDEKRDYYVYFGEFVEDNLEGYGELYQGNNCKYSGEFYENETTDKGFYRFK